jgi:hypothetical protein
VVHREQQHVLLGAQPQQRRTEERARREVERPPRLLAGAPPDRRLAIRLASPDRSSTGRANPPKGAITCTGEPSTSAKTVRSAS